MFRSARLARFPLHPLALAAVAALHALPALAQTTTGSTPTAPAAQATLPTVTVQASADASADGLPGTYPGGQVARGGRVGVLGTLGLMDAPFSSTSYTAQLIADQQAQSIADVLLNDPAVRATRGFGNFQQAYFIRGFPVYSDDVAYNGLYGLVPRQYMATEFVERVNVLRGANAFLNGAGGGSTAGGGLGGLIDVVPKRAPNEPLTSVTLGVQSGGQGYAALDLARRFGADNATGIRLNLASRNGGVAINNEKDKLDAFGVGLDWRSASVRLSADIGYQNNQQDAPRPSVTPGAGLPIPGAPDATINFAQPWTYSNEKDTFGTLRGEWDISDKVTAWGAWGTRSSEEANVLANPTLTNTQGATTAYRFDNARKDKISTGEVGLRAKFATGDVRHTLTVSYSGFDMDSRNAYALSNFAGFTGSIYQPFAAAEPANTYFTGGKLDNPLTTEKITTGSLAVADTMGFANDTVLLTLGARRQSIKDEAFDYDSGKSSGAYDQSRTTPVAGLVVKVDKNLSLYANYIEGLVKGDTANGTGITNAGQIFAPYVSRQKEAGLKYDAGSFGASAAVFSVSKPSAYVQGTVYGVFGEQRNQGLELSTYGQPMKGLRLLGGITLVDAEQVTTAGGANNGKDAIGVPKHQFNLGVDWDVPGTRGLAFNARLIETGSQYADGANTQSLPAWTRLDIGARYVMNIGDDRLLTLRARVDNLTNKAYWAAAGGYPGYGYLTLGQPRTVSLSATVDF